jgi:hypothetical protein
MTTTYHRDLVQGSGEWLDARRGILTASTIGKVLTPTLKVADNDTSRGLIYMLAAERITGHVEYVHPTWDMQRGTDDEPYARAIYAENYAPVEEVGFITRENNGVKLGYSPDGLIGDNGLIEIKSRKPHAHLALLLFGGIPHGHMAQMQTGMHVTGRAWCDYIGYSAGLPLHVFRVQRDDDWQLAIEKAATAFEERIGELVDKYNTTTAGLVATERRDDLDEIRI